jgi:hypothetical protein
MRRDRAFKLLTENCDRCGIPILSRILEQSMHLDDALESMRLVITASELLREDLCRGCLLDAAAGKDLDFILQERGRVARKGQYQPPADGELRWLMKAAGDMAKAALSEQEGERDAIRTRLRLLGLSPEHHERLKGLPEDVLSSWAAELAEGQC